VVGQVLDVLEDHRLQVQKKHHQNERLRNGLAEPKRTILLPLLPHKAVQTMHEKELEKPLPCYWERQKKEHVDEQTL
jgi:hypothetical protein